MKAGDVREHKGQGNELLLLLHEDPNSSFRRQWWALRLETGELVRLADKWLIHDTRPYGV